MLVHKYVDWKGLDSDAMQAMKHPSEEIRPRFKTQGRHHQGSKTGLSVD